MQIGLILSNNKKKYSKKYLKGIDKLKKVLTFVKSFGGFGGNDYGQISPPLSKTAAKVPPLFQGLGYAAARDSCKNC